MAWVKTDEHRPWANTWFRNRLMVLAGSTLLGEKIQAKNKATWPGVELVGGCYIA